MPKTPTPDDSYYLRTSDNPPTLLPRNSLANALATALCDALPEDVRVPIEDTGLFYINSQHVPRLAEVLQEVVAYTVATIIDAGSERDAVMENAQLTIALENELYGWCEDPYRADRAVHNQNEVPPSIDSFTKES